VADHSPIGGIMSRKDDTHSVQKSDAEWKKELDPLQHHVLRDHGTERPFTSPLHNEKRQGTFRCAALKFDEKK